jgi:SlyX protein
MSIKELNARIETLETQAAYQERTIEELNRMVTEQWTEIGHLRALLDALARQLREIADSPALAGPPEPPPPHY